MPNPLPPADRKRYQTEFTQWAIGQGLLEIDQSYHRYVVSALDTLTDLESFLRDQSLMGHRKPNLANTWAVHEQFYAKLGQQSTKHEDESGYLRSLGHARNCLAHDSGTVTKIRMADGKSTMAVRWPGRDLINVDQSGNRSVLPLNRTYRVRKDDVGSQLVIQDVVREHNYSEGDRVSFSETDLSEIIFFYQILAMKIGAEMHRIAREKMAETRF
ncbi:hypothetical protein [Pseudotabrizicola formosa]|uniref:hypothetical protein n=1 Tax=Pseudotabrizicola formosa TaxID=2030009 RepID=UPI0011AEEEA1|nr:hypothetical protein [Pseudotabrizicola formosa]